MNLIALQTIRDSVGQIVEGQPFVVADARARALIDSGKACTDAEYRKRRWAGLDWPGSTVVIIASGPSLTVEDCERVRQWRSEASDRKCITINTSFRLTPWADVLYACDCPWWAYYIEEVREKFQGALWTQDEEAKRKFGINLIHSERGAGLSKRFGVINQGGNGGYQSINLAVQAGARRVILLGLDMRNDGDKTHHHGDHPPALRSALNFSAWIPQFTKLADDLKAEGVRVVNATEQSALQCFEKMNLIDALDA